MVKRKILQDLKKVIEGLGYITGDPDKIGTDIVLSIPKNPQFGDYTTNIALQLAKQKSQNGKQNPGGIANEIVDRLQGTVDPLRQSDSEASSGQYLEKAEVAGGGFINFFVKPNFLATDIKEILERGEDFGNSDFGKNKKARVEFISANPTGPLHIGNARGGPLGDVIANVLSSQGFRVLREYIDNNVGEQIKSLGATLSAKYHGNLSEENQYKGEYIDELIKSLSDQIEGKSDQEIGEMAVEKLNEEIMADSHQMGIKFDLVVRESELRKEAPEVIEELKKSGVIKEKDGALWLAPNDEFLKDRETVVQKSDGTYTYFTSDIVYHKMKFASGADLIIDVFGSNHHGHVPRLQAAVASLGFDPKKLNVILYQYVRVKRGEVLVKMSKRAGDFITAREVLDEVGKDAFRFYLLRFAPQTHMDFDIELLKEHSSKNPVYYVQYAYVRMSSILKKVESGEGEEVEDADYGLLADPNELNLIKHLLYFPDLTEEIAGSLQVHKLTEYAINLADLFHKFYENCPVLSAENKQLSDARLSLVRAARITLANTLKLLGVSAPEEM